MVRGFSLAGRWLDRDLVRTCLVLIVHLCVIDVKLDNFAVLGPIVTLHSSFCGLWAGVVLLKVSIVFSWRSLIRSLILPLGFDPLLGFLSPDFVSSGCKSGASVGPNFVDRIVLGSCRFAR